jgi:hypothetical protein
MHAFKLHIFLLTNLLILTIALIFNEKAQNRHLKLILSNNANNGSIHFKRRIQNAITKICDVHANFVADGRFNVHRAKA